MVADGDAARLLEPAGEDAAEGQSWPPPCPSHPQWRMQAHPRGWAWLCPVEASRGEPSPQPAWPVRGRDGRIRWVPVPLTPPARRRAVVA
jgi:hypothetical protein